MTKKIQTAIYLDPDVHKELLDSGLAISKICNIILRRILKDYKDMIENNLSQKIPIYDVRK